MYSFFIAAISLCFFPTLSKWSADSCDTYATHQPVLYYIAAHTTGPIIEFGCGHGSTDILHEICKETGRLLVSIDDNKEWLDIFTHKYYGDGYTDDNSGWHKFYLVAGKIDDSNPAHWIQFLEHFELLQTVPFELCFVDQSPGSARTETIMRLKDTIKYIILHDCDMFVSGELGTQIQPLNSEHNIPGIYDFSQTFKYFKVYFPPKPWPGHSGPPTLLGSNFESDLPDIDYENY
jgi:hypothetical protein